jgi:hypothetical protein
MLKDPGSVPAPPTKQKGYYREKVQSMEPAQFRYQGRENRDRPKRVADVGVRYG